MKKFICLFFVFWLLVSTACAEQNMIDTEVTFRGYHFGTKLTDVIRELCKEGVAVSDAYVTTPGNASVREMGYEEDTSLFDYAAAITAWSYACLDGIEVAGYVPDEAYLFGVLQFDDAGRIDQNVNNAIFTCGCYDFYAADVDSMYLDLQEKLISVYGPYTQCSEIPDSLWEKNKFLYHANDVIIEYTIWRSTVNNTFIVLKKWDVIYEGNIINNDRVRLMYGWLDGDDNIPALYDEAMLEEREAALEEERRHYGDGNTNGL